jgi:hypothetical protein
MKSPQIPATPLDLLEQKFNEVAAILAAGDADNVLQASEALQSVVVEFAELAGPAGGLQLKLKPDVVRLKALARGISLLRDTVLRRAAHVNQALAIVVPTPAKSTYSGAGSPFSAVPRQSGQFRVLAA